MPLKIIMPMRNTNRLLFIKEKVAFKGFTSEASLVVAPNPELGSMRLHSIHHTNKKCHDHHGHGNMDMWCTVEQQTDTDPQKKKRETPQRETPVRIMKTNW